MRFGQKVFSIENNFDFDREKADFDREKVDFWTKQVLDIPTPGLTSNNLSDLGGDGFGYTFGCSWCAMARHEQPTVYQTFGLGREKFDF